jgi:hypothetical protein
VDTLKQRETCARLRLDYLPCEPNLKIGIARNVREGVLPIHGVRHKPEGDTTGWYIWAGGEPLRMTISSFPSTRLT